MAKFSEHIPDKLLSENVYLKKFIDTLDQLKDYKSKVLFNGVKGIGNRKIILDKEYLIKIVHDVSDIPADTSMSMSMLSHLANSITSFTKGSCTYGGIDDVLTYFTSAEIEFVNLDDAYPQLCLCFDELDKNRCLSQLPSGADLFVAANNPRHFLFPFDIENGFSAYYRRIDINITGYDAMPDLEKTMIQDILHTFIFTNDSLSINIISV